MKKHDNTLYITTQKAYLSKDGANIVISVERKERLRMPIHNLGNIVCFGNVSASPFVMGFCAENGTGISFHTEYGKFLVSITGQQTGNVSLRRLQHKLTLDDSSKSQAAYSFISAKIANCRNVLLRAKREHFKESVSHTLDIAINKLKLTLSDFNESLDVESIRGVEGDTARTYFSAFNDLILTQKESFHFANRTRRPPLDNVNALLSFIYMLLSSDVKSACESTGLDPQMGFLHADRSGRPSLALDLMEELRPFIADRLVLSLINRNQVTGKDFIKREAGEVKISDKARKVILVAYQERKSDEITHPFLKEKMTVGILPFVQARLLSRWLRGDIDRYPSYFMK